VRAAPDDPRIDWQSPPTIKISVASVGLQRPKLCHARAALCHLLSGSFVTWPDALGALVVFCSVRGPSERDEEATTTWLLGGEARGQTVRRSIGRGVDESEAAPVHDPETRPRPTANGGPVTSFDDANDLLVIRREALLSHPRAMHRRPG
jgi:hypothetical protein